MVVWLDNVRLEFLLFPSPRLHLYHLITTKWLLILQASHLHSKKGEGKIGKNYLPGSPCLLIEEQPPLSPSLHTRQISSYIFLVRMGSHDHTLTNH